MIRVFEIEGALVQLRDSVTRVQYDLRLVQLSYDQPRQGHARHGAHKLHSGAVVNVAVFDDKLFALAAVIIDQVDHERAPLISARIENSVLTVQVSCANCLRAQTIKQGYFGTRCNTD